MAAVILASAGVALMWLAYTTGLRVAERRADAAMARYRWRLNHPTELPRIEP